MSQPIDPVKMREAVKRIHDQRYAAAKAETAAEALLWFAEYGESAGLRHEGRNVTGVLNAATLIASGTPNAKLAQEYVRAATVALEGAIIDKAIELAQADLALATKEPS